MILAEFLLIRYVTTITASCSDLASPTVKSTCSTTGHAAHHWALAIVGLATILMAFGTAVGRSRPAATALLVLGLVSLFVTLVIDLPKTGSKGEVGPNFANAQAHIGAGLWFELIGALLAVGAALFALTRLPGVATGVVEAPAEEPAEPARRKRAAPAREDADEAEIAPAEEAEAVPTEEAEAAPAEEAEAVPTEEAEAPPGEEPEARVDEAGAEAPTAGEVPGPEGRRRRARGGRWRPALGRARRRRREGEPAADIGVDEGSEGEAVEPASPEAEAVEAHEREKTVEARSAEEEAVEPTKREDPERRDAEPAKPRGRPTGKRRAAGAPEKKRPEGKRPARRQDATAGDAASQEPEGETWDVIPDTPAARRSAERRRKRQERAEAARRRQQRPPRERARKKRPEGPPENDKSPEGPENDKQDE